MIYQDDIRACNAYAQRDADALNRSALFVLATIQQLLETVPVALTDMVERGVLSRFAWGHKAKGVEYLAAHNAEFYRAAIAARDDPVELLHVFLHVPGFALVKAGFLCQIFAGSVGCIDLHNVKIYGVSIGDVRYRLECKPATLAKKRVQYVALCESLGGAAPLWSRWCDYVATLRPKNWADGAEVSKFHIDVITGLETGAIVDLFTDVEYEPTFRQELKS